jgi:type I restriction enzyme S subunit
MRGDSKQSRIDVDYFHPEFVELKKKIHSLSKTVLISKILSKNLRTGFPAGKNDQEEKNGLGVIQIRPTQIKIDGEINLIHPIRVKEENCSLSDILNKGEVLFNNTNSSILVGKSVVFNSTKQCVCSNHITRLTLKEEFEPQFIMEVLNWLQRRKYFYRLCTNFNNQAGVNNDALVSVEIPMPAKTERKKILSYLQNARKDFNSKLLQAEELLKGLDEYILVKLDIVKPTEERIKIFSRKRSETLNSRIDPHFHSPYYKKVLKAVKDSKFIKHPLSSLLVDIAGGATPKKGDADLYDTSGIKFLRILNVKPNFIDLEDVKYIQSHVHNGELLRSQLRHDDVVMTITGRVGTSSTIEEEILPANINQHLVRLRIKDQKCLPKYLSAYLNTTVGNAMTNKGVSGGTRIAVDYKWVGLLPIPVPPKGIQQEIIDEVNHRKEEASRLKTEAETEWQNVKKWFEGQLFK